MNATTPCPVYRRYEQTQKNPGRKGAFLVRYHDVAAANFLKGTRNLPWYSHALRKSHPHRHPWHILPLHGLRSYVRSPIFPVASKCRTHQSRLLTLVQSWPLLLVLWLPVVHSPASGSLHHRNAGSSRIWAAFLFPRSLGHVLPLNGFVGLPVPYWRPPRGYLYVLPQCKLHHTRLRLEELLAVFFYNPFSQLAGHCLHIARVKVQLLSNLLVGKVEPHEIETQNPNFQGLMVSGKYGSRQVIKALTAIFALIALFSRLCLIKTSSNHSLRIAKRAFSSFRPTEFAHGIETLPIVYQARDLNLH